MNVTVYRNESCKGVELYFDEKPSADTLEELKNHNFRWHRKKKCWYAKENDKTNAYVEEKLKELYDKYNEPAEEEPAVVENSVDKSVENSNDNVVEFPVSDTGIKVGDIFCASWGYEQTNVNFFRVKALRGKTQVVIQEVTLKVLSEEAVSDMSVNRIYDAKDYVVNETSLFVSDVKNGDVKKILGDEDNQYISVEKYVNAYLYHGEKVFESWYA